MAGRFDLRPLLTGLTEGLRKRRNNGTEPPDTRARWTLVGVPTLLAVGAAATGVELEAPDQVLAAVAVYAGALLAAFALIAGWRDSIVARGRSVDGARLRSLREAGAHILMSVVVAAALSALLAADANLTISDAPTWLAEGGERAFHGALVWLFAYLLLTLVLVTNLLWDAFDLEGSDQRSGV